MRLIVDGDTSFPLALANPSPIDTLNEVDRQLREAGRAIVKVTADGHELLPHQLREFTGLRAGTPPEEIRIESESVAQLVQASVNEVQELLPELPVVCHGLAEALHGEPTGESLGQFDQFAAIWAAIRERRALILNALELDPAAIQTEVRSVAAHDDAVYNQLTAAQEALNEQDYPRVSDILEYELAPLAEDEEAVFALLAAQAPPA